MTRLLIFSCSALFIASLVAPPMGFPQKADSIIQDFKVQALYRAAKLTWKVKEGVKGGASVQILRADSFEDAPYKELEAVNLSPGIKNAFTKEADNSLVFQAPRLNNLMSQFIGIDYPGSSLSKEFSYGSFTGAKTAGYSDDWHFL